MHTKRTLAARAGFLPALAVLVMTSLFVVAGTNARPALALVAPPLPVYLPGSLVTGSAVVADAAGTVAVGSAAAAAGGVAVVAAGGFAIGYGSGLAGTAAVKLVWGWASGHSSSYAAIPVQQGGIQAGSLYCMESSTFRTTASDPGTVGTCNANVNLSGTFKNVGTSATVVLCRYTSSSLSSTGGPITLGTNGQVAQSQLVSGVVAETIRVGSACPAGVGDGRVPGRYIGTAPGSVAANNDPTVTTIPTSSCTGGVTVSGVAITYKGSDVTPPPMVAPACPAGTSRTGFTTPTTAGGSTAPAPLAPWTAPTIPSAFPECNPAGNCQLVLTKVAPGGSTFTCNGTDECQGWSTLPELAPKRTVWDVTTGTQVLVLVPTAPDGSTYRCQWGPYELKASECKTVPTEPGTGTSTGDEADADGANGCHWKLSKPWTWPYTALVCAFVPPPGTFEAGWTSINWCASAPGVLTCAVSELVAPFTHLGESGPGADCHGAEIGVPVLDPRTTGSDADLTLHPWDACSNAAQAISGFWIPFSSAAIYLGGVFLGARMLASTIGAKEAV
jgi:hypothetical protein